MSDSGNNPDWWIDGVSVGSSETAPEQGSVPAPGTVSDETGHGSTPPGGVPAVSAPQPGPTAVGGPAPAPQVAGAAAAAGATATLAAAADDESADQKKRKRWPIVLLSLVVLVGLALIVFFVLVTKGPSYTATHGSGTIASGPSSVRVAVVVKNTGTSTGRPVCTVHLAAPNGGGSGHGTFKEPPVEAGKSALFFNTVNVTKTSAHLMDSTAKIEVTCK